MNRHDKLLDDVRRGLGAHPYNSWSNPCVNDGYYWQELRRKWPHDELKEAVEEVQAQQPVTLREVTESDANQCGAHHAGS